VVEGSRAALHLETSTFRGTKHPRRETSFPSLASVSGVDSRDLDWPRSGLQARGRQPAHPDQGDYAYYQRRCQKHEQEQSEDTRAVVESIAKAKTEHHRKLHRDALCCTSKAAPILKGP
jgi:hypothetical protein